MNGEGSQRREATLRNLAFLAEAGGSIAESLDQTTILRRVARALVPEIADWCSIDVRLPDGGVERATLAHSSPAMQPIAEVYGDQPPPEGSPIRDVLASGRPVLLRPEDMTAELFRRATDDPAKLAIIEEIGVLTAVLVPLTAREQPLGVLSLTTTRESGRILDAADLQLAEEIGRRVASALENARLFREAEESSTRYRALMQNIDAIVWEADACDLSFRFVSERAERILGWPVTAWFDAPGFWSGIVHPDDRLPLTQALRGPGARQRETEFRARAADGRIVWLRTRASVEPDADGRPGILRGVMTDITDRRFEERNERAQNAVDRVFATVRAPGELPRELLSAVCAAIDWDVGALWMLEEPSQTLRCVDLWHSTQVSVREFEALTRRIAFPKGIGLPGRVWETGRPSWIEDVCKDDNFPRAPMASRAELKGAFGFPIIAGGRILGVIEFFSREARPPDHELLSVMETIGGQVGQFFERLRVEQALRESEARANAVLEASLDAIVSMDHDGRIVAFNPAAERIFRYRAEEVIGHRLAEKLIPPARREPHRRGLQRYLATRDPHILGKRLELTAMRSDGAEFPVEVTVARVDAAGPPLFTGYIRDITDRETAERRRDAQHATTLVLAEAETLAEATPRILDAICTSLDWELGALWTVDAGAGVLRFVDVWHRPWLDARAFVEASRRLTFAPGVGIPGRTWSSREPLWVPDAAEEPGLGRAEEIASIGLHGAFAFPVRAGGRVLGAMEFFSRQIREPDGDLLGMLATIGSQIGQFIVRKSAEEETRFQRALLESQNQATIDGIVIVGRDGRLRSFNRRFAELWEIPDGATVEEIERRVFGKHADPAQARDRSIELWRNPDLVDRAELQLTDGRIFDRYSAPLRGETGEVYGRAYYYRDITERKRTESALAGSSRRFAFLAEATTVLGSSLDYQRTLRALAEISVPFLADWCVIDVLDQEGTLRRVALHHSDADLLASVGDFDVREAQPLGIARRGAPNVVRTGRAEFASKIPQEWLEEEAGGDPALLDVIRSLGVQSYMCVPLIARGTPLGAITLISAESGRRYTEEDLALAEDLARRAALAIDNARLYSEREHVADTLQQSLLPPHLPEIEGIDVAAAYRPAALEVGGDFYDLFRTGKRDWAIVIGDVCGKGADAAALTALARYTIRAAALQTRDPARVLTHLNDALLSQAADERFCTVSYARLGPPGTDGRRRLVVSCGGHPLPYLVRRSGVVEPVGRPGGLLGAFPRPSLAKDDALLGPGDAAVFYTDGVLESRGKDGFLGEEGLRDLLARCAGLDAQTIASKVMAAAAGSGQGTRDDVAVVVLRVAG